MTKKKETETMFEEIPLKEQGLETLWNGIVDCLLDASALWEELSGRLVEDKTLVLQLDKNAQRMLARVQRHAKFDVMLERLISLWVTQGGLEALRIKEN